MATILVADDEAAVRQLVRTILGGCGHRVLLAANRAEALGLAAGEPVDLLITDVVTPGGGGRELADRLARAVPPVPVLFVSGALAGRGGDGRASFLGKPFSARDLLSRVETLLAVAQPAGAGTGGRNQPC